MTLYQNGRDPFVGRDAELDELAHKLARMLDGRACSVLVQGEAGVGKTRLLREIAAIARRLQVNVVQGRAIDDAATPYLPFLATFELCASEPTSDQLALAPGQALEHERWRFVGSMLRRLLGLARRQPLLLLLDDLHWADPDSLDFMGQLLLALADDLRDERLHLMIVAAHRPLANHHRLSGLCERWRRERIADVLELSGLPAAQTHLLLCSLGLQHVDQALLDQVQRATHGFPLFVREVCEQLGRLDTSPDDAASAAAYILRAGAHGMSTMLAQRLASLREQDCELLVYAAWMSDAFSLERLAHVAKLSVAATQRSLERAMAAALIVSDGPHYRFRHPLIREVLADKMPETRRGALHRQIAAALEAEPASEALSLEIAEHLSAVPDHAPRHMLYHASRGAKHAFAHSAWSKAASLYVCAIAAADSCRDVPSGELAELHLQCALAHQLQYAFQASLAHYNQALRAFAEAQDAAGQARTLRLLTRLRYSMNDMNYGQSTDLGWHRRVLRSLDQGASRVRGALLESMAFAYWSGRQTARAQVLVRRALALAISAGDAELHGDASFVLGLILWQAGRLHEAHAYFETCRDGFAHDDWARSLPLSRLAALNIGLGQIQLAQGQNEQSASVGERFGNVSESAFVATNRAVIALVRGDLCQAQQLAAEGVLLARRTSWTAGELRALITLSAARSLDACHDDAIYALQGSASAADLFEGLGPALRFGARVWLDLLRLRAGDARELAKVRELVARAAPKIDRAPFDAWAAYLYCVLIECAFHFDVGVDVRKSQERLQRLCNDGMVLVYDGSFLVKRMLALASVVLGAEADADREFREAAELAQRIGARLELGMSLLEHAQWLVRRTRPDRERARLLALSARATFAELGLQSKVASALRVVEACGSALPLEAAATRNAWAAVETQLLRRIAQGRDAVQIARELMLAPERVEQMSDALYEKLDVSGPGLATAYALAHGIITGAIPAAFSDSSVLMVTDMVNFTGMLSRLGDMAGRRVVHMHNRVIRESLAAHNGREVTHTGDGFIATFRDGADALDCATAIQRAFVADPPGSSGEAVRVRIGLNAGRVIPEEGRLFGAALVVAVRICARARGGQILLAKSVLDVLPRSSVVRANAVGEAMLKGFAEPFVLFEVA